MERAEAFDDEEFQKIAAVLKPPDDREETSWEFTQRLFFVFGLTFCMRGQEEHHEMLLDDLELGTQRFKGQNIEVLYWGDRISKTNQGGITSRKEQRSISAVANTFIPWLCPVAVYKKLLERRKVVEAANASKYINFLVCEILFVVYRLVCKATPL